jgi:hypothetical protein
MFHEDREECLHGTVLLLIDVAIRAFIGGWSKGPGDGGSSRSFIGARIISCHLPSRPLVLIWLGCSSLVWSMEYLAERIHGLAVLLQLLHPLLLGGC